MADKFTKVQNENAQLNNQVAMLTLKVENYGLLFSGNSPGRITPNNYEISKRLGTLTV